MQGGIALWGAGEVHSANFGVQEQGTASADARHARGTRPYAARRPCSSPASPRCARL